MTRRVSSMLLSALLSCTGVPGCAWFKCCQSPGDDGLQKDDKPLRTNHAATMEPRAEVKPGDPVSLAAQREGSPIPREKPNAGEKPDTIAQYGSTTMPPAEGSAITAGKAKREPLVDALQCFLEGRHKEALALLQAYDADTQVFYLRVLPTLTLLAHKRVNDLTATEVAVLNDQLQNLLTTLRPRTELTIDRMCYCESVKNFGIYQPLDEGHAFVAAESSGQPGELVRLYVELRNFASVPSGSAFETRLSSRIEIRDSQGTTVWWADHFDHERKQMRTLSRLTDFCATYLFVTPNLPPGAYQLVLMIADETMPGVRRVAQKSLEFRITSVGTRSQ